MKKLLVALMFISTSVMTVIAQDFYSELSRLISKASNSELETFLNNSSVSFLDYYSSTGPKKSALNLLYEKKRLDLMPILLKYYPELNTLEITSMSGGHPPTWPTISFAVSDGDLETTELLLKLGFPANRTFSTIARLRPNLLSLSRSSAMDSLLLKYGTSPEIYLNSWTIDTIDENIRVRDSPSVTGKVIGVLGKGIKGKLVKYYFRPETISGSKNYWYYVEMENGIVGWSFGSFYHVRELDGM